MKRQTGSDSGFQFLVLEEFLSILRDSITTSYSVFCVRHRCAAPKKKGVRGDVRLQKVEEQNGVASVRKLKLSCYSLP